MNKVDVLMTQLNTQLLQSQLSSMCKRMKPKMEESVLVFVCILPALTELVIGIRRLRCGLSTYSAPCLAFSVPF